MPNFSAIRTSSANDPARIPIDRNRRDSASRIEASSSIANTIGSCGFKLYLPLSIGSVKQKDKGA